MNALAGTTELTVAYEALRAQATGQMPTTTPRGLALCLTAGLPTWMKAWAPLSPAVPPSATTGSRTEGTPIQMGGEVVRLLTEMALGCQRRGAA